MKRECIMPPSCPSLLVASSAHSRCCGTGAGQSIVHTHTKSICIGRIYSSCIHVRAYREKVLARVLLTCRVRVE